MAAESSLCSLWMAMNGLIAQFTIDSEHFVQAQVRHLHLMRRVHLERTILLR
jgi:hypothetical protein